MQSPEFLPPSNTTDRERLIGFTSANNCMPQTILNRSSYSEWQDVQNNTIFVQAEVTKEGESEEQRNRRLAYQQKQSVLNRSNENEEQRNSRLADQRKRSASSRSNESEEQRNTRLVSQQERSAANRSDRSEERRMPRQLLRQQNSESIQSIGENQQTIEKNQVINKRRQQGGLAGSRKTLFDQYKWPAAIPTPLKEYCLEDFCNHTSMTALQQSICIICNIRVSASTMKQCDFRNISNLANLSCHADLTDVISKIASQTTQNGDFIYRMTFRNIKSFFS